jgi:hypothetical protein
MADSQGNYQFMAASPIASSGVDMDEYLANLGRDQSNVLQWPLAPGASPTAAQPGSPSPLAAAAGKPQAAVAPASTPAPATGTATNQPAAQDAKPYGMTLDNKSPMEGFGQSLAAGAQSQIPATNAPTTDKTGAPAVPGTVTPTGTPDDPNQAGIQRAGTMAENFADKLQGQPTLAETLKPIQAQRTLPPQEYDPAHPEYKPSPGRRFMRGLEAVGEGVARRGIMGGLLGGLDPAAVGATPYSAPTREFSIAAKKQAAQQGSLDQQAATAEKAFTADTGRAKDIITSINDIGKNYAAGQNAQARMDTAAARADTARVAGQLADIKQQVADYQSQGKTPTTFEATSAAWALEKDPAKKAALEAALDYDRETEIRKFQYKPEDGEAHSAFRQSMIDSATEQIKALQDKYTYNAKRNQYVNPNNPNDVLNPSEYTDKKNEIASKLDQQLGQKKMKPLRVRFDPADAGAGKPTGRAAQQTPAAAPATTPQAKRPAPPTPTIPPPDGAADMALGSDGQYHYRDAGKKDLGVVK